MLTAPLLIHFEHLPPTGDIRVRVAGSPHGTVVRDRRAAEILAARISGGNFRAIDGLGPRQRRKPARWPL